VFAFLGRCIWKKTDLNIFEIASNCVAQSRNMFIPEMKMKQSVNLKKLLGTFDEYLCRTHVAHLLFLQD
jgi:hypothetical protein